MVEEWITLISQVGFPIAITLWFMFRMEKVINRNTDALEKLESKIGGCPYNGRTKKR